MSKKPKVYTITCHDVYNHGAALQAFALQSFCESLGCEYKIIDYKPDYLSSHHNLWKIANPKYNKPFIKQIYLLAKLPSRLIQYKRKLSFDRFKSKYLKITHQRFNNLAKLKSNCPDGNLFIAGSDQIWNTIFDTGHDPAFYLDFVGENVRKISYAASFATDKIYKNASELIKAKLKNFDAVSVREQSALTILRDLNRNDGVLVTDPVFLIDTEIWEKLADKSSIRLNQNYILIYDCEKSQELTKIAKRLSSLTNLPIYSVSPIKSKFAAKDFSLAGPLDFLHLIKNASFVISNSFHATAYSVIYKRDFYTIIRSEKINIRMQDFLNYISLSDRLIDSEKEITLTSVDFTTAAEKINELAQFSKTFLKNQIKLSAE